MTFSFVPFFTRVVLSAYLFSVFDSVLATTIEFSLGATAEGQLTDEWADAIRDRESPDEFARMNKDLEEIAHQTAFTVSPNYSARENSGIIG